MTFEAGGNAHKHAGMRLERCDFRNQVAPAPRRLSRAPAMSLPKGHSALALWSSMGLARARRPRDSRRHGGATVPLVTSGTRFPWRLALDYRHLYVLVAEAHNESRWASGCSGEQAHRASTRAS